MTIVKGSACDKQFRRLEGEAARIKTIHGGKKIVRSLKTEKAYLAYDRDEIEYEKLVLQSFQTSKAFNESSLNLRLWVAQRIEVIERFISEYHRDA